MTYAQRIASAHGRIRTKFGTVSDTAMLYVWHNGAQVRCYESTGRNQRNLLASIVVKDETLTVNATKAEFTTVPQTGDEVKFGTTLATARTLRIDSIQTNTIRPFYALDLIDPNKEATAA
jgi:hypothetical protein